MSKRYLILPKPRLAIDPSFGELLIRTSQSSRTGPSHKSLRVSEKRDVSRGHVPVTLLVNQT